VHWRWGAAEIPAQGLGSDVGELEADEVII
jgi:hypothetical protein